MIPIEPEFFIFGLSFERCNQGGHGTGKTEKTGNLTLTFSKQGKHREFCCDTGKIFETQGKYFDCILLCECYIFMYFWQSWFQIMGGEGVGDSLSPIAHKTRFDGFCLGPGKMVHPHHAS